MRSTPATASPDSALVLIKPEVRAAAGYTLQAPAAPRKLNQNESPYDVPAAVKAAVLERARQAVWSRYPAFAPNELLARLATRHGWVADGVLVGNGSNELIQATLAVTIGPGTAVVTPVPTFALYRLLTTVQAGRYVGVPLGQEFEFDIGALIRAAREHRAAVIVVNTPNSPTGTPMPDDGVRRLLRDTQALVVVDEAYQDFGGPTAVPLLAEHPRLVVLRTFSKAMAMAGLRFGYLLAHPAVAREIGKAKLPYNVNQITLAAAHAALDHSGAFEELVARVRRTRDRLTAELARIPGLVSFPTAANFVLVRCEARPAAEIFRRLVEEHGILVRDVSSGPGLAECLRITVGTDDDADAVVRGLRETLGRSA
ncbi:MAG TPA: histidinol-phosphate transaminase [Gemmatimonadales bacterium]